METIQRCEGWWLRALMRRERGFRMVAERRGRTTPEHVWGFIPFVQLVARN